MISRPLRSRPEDPKMEENEIGKDVVDAAVKDGGKRMINGLEVENLGVFGSLREPPSLRGEQPTSPSASPSLRLRVSARDK